MNWMCQPSPIRKVDRGQDVLNFEVDLITKTVLVWNAQQLRLGNQLDGLIATQLLINWNANVARNVLPLVPLAENYFKNDELMMMIKTKCLSEWCAVQATMQLFRAAQFPWHNTTLIDRDHDHPLHISSCAHQLKSSRAEHDDHRREWHRNRGEHIQMESDVTMDSKRSVFVGPVSCPVSAEYWQRVTTVAWRPFFDPEMIPARVWCRWWMAIENVFL